MRSIYSQLKDIILECTCPRLVRVNMVLNATFNNISVISWQLYMFVHVCKINKTLHVMPGIPNVTRGYLNLYYLPDLM